MADGLLEARDSASCEMVEDPAESEAEQQLKEECVQLWAQLQKLQDELQKEKTVISTSEEDPLKDIYAAKEKKLNAEIKVFGDFKPDVFTQNDAVQEDLLVQELHESNMQLNNLLVLLRSQSKELKENLDSLNTMQDHSTRIHDRLSERLEEVTSNHGQQVMHEADLMEKLKTKTSKLSKYFRKITKEMAEFIKVHFPLPEPRPPNLHSLQTVLESLLNQCFTTPHDPYVVIDQNYWEPFVELLLRTGIAQRHPQDDKRIKITPVHL